MDSELQIGLVALGVAAVVGIVAYNKWQESKHRRHAEKAFRSEHRDVLLEAQESEGTRDGRMEPRLENEEDDDAVVAVPRTRATPVMQPSGRRSSPGVPDAADPRLDCIIRIESIEPLDVPRLWSAQREQMQSLNKPICWFAFDDRENVWRALTPHSAGAHHWFCVAMQMVDRRGAIGEEEFQLFSGGVQRVADQFLAVPADIPARAAALASAAEMDAFCASVDVQVGVNIVSNGEPFAGTKIRALAESGGMTLGDDGAFHARDEEGRTLFSLSNLEPGLFSAGEMRNIRTSGITLLIDIPLVADGVGTFDRMMRQANQMAEVLHGSVVDDNRVPFGPQAAALIRSQIQQYQAEMASRRIPAGGELATRLFSA
jgi:hypothetical protein